MHIVEASADRLVFSVENVSTIRRLLVAIFRPGEMQSIYFMDRESDNVWRYYAILRPGKERERTGYGERVVFDYRAVALLSPLYRNLGNPGTTGSALSFMATACLALDVAWALGLAGLFAHFR
jgi:hypothetical protein